MTNPLARVAMKSLSDFKPAGTTSKRLSSYGGSPVGNEEENLIKSLIKGDLKAKGVSGKQVYTLEELAKKMKNNY